MNPKDISSARNPDQRASLVAMRRAAQMARQIAIQTNTAIILHQDGKMVRPTSCENRIWPDQRQTDETEPISPDGLPQRHDRQAGQPPWRTGRQEAGIFVAPVRIRL